MDNVELTPELAELAKSHPIETNFVAADLRKLAPDFADPLKRASAEATIQGWADGAPSLRKSFAAAWLARARGTLAGAASKVGQAERTFSKTHPMGARLATTGIAAGAATTALEANKSNSTFDKAQAVEPDPKPVAKLAGGELQKVFVGGWLRRGALAAKSKLRGSTTKVKPDHAAKAPGDPKGWKASEQVAVGGAGVAIGAGALALSSRGNTPSNTEQDGLGKAAPTPAPGTSS